MGIFVCVAVRVEWWYFWRHERCVFECVFFVSFWMISIVCCQVLLVLLFLFYFSVCVCVFLCFCMCVCVTSRLSLWNMFVSVRACVSFIRWCCVFVWMKATPGSDAVMVRSRNSRSESKCLLHAKSMGMLILTTKQHSEHLHIITRLI